ERTASRQSASNRLPLNRLTSVALDSSSPTGAAPQATWRSLSLAALRPGLASVRPYFLPEAFKRFFFAAMFWVIFVQPVHLPFKYALRLIQHIRVWSCVHKQFTSDK